jgi:hypothetical protein
MSRAHIQNLPTTSYHSHAEIAPPTSPELSGTFEACKNRRSCAIPAPFNCPLIGSNPGHATISNCYFRRSLSVALRRQRSHVRIVSGAPLRFVPNCWRRGARSAPPRPCIANPPAPRQTPRWHRAEPCHGCQGAINRRVRPTVQPRSDARRGRACNSGFRCHDRSARSETPRRAHSTAHRPWQYRRRGC